MYKSHIYILSILLVIFSGIVNAKTHGDTDTWMQEIWNNVEELDQNRDGKITRDEYTIYWEKLYEFADINKDDTISEYEWRLVLEGKKYSYGATQKADINKDNFVSASEANTYWKKRFGKADLNRDGKLSRVEARSLLESNLMGVYGEDYQVVFNLSQFIDKNNDGTISLQEFQSYWTAEHGKADLNNDGKVSKYEFRALLESKRMEHESL